MKRILNFQYATVHGTYWMYYGVVCSFASVFLLGRGYSNSEIGIILAVGNVLAVLLQPLMADMADRSKKLTIVGISQTMTAVLIVSTAVMMILTHKTLALSILFIFIVGWLTALQPLFNSMSFRISELGIHINFGMARSMGSLAYAIMCAFLGTLVERYGIGILPISGEIVLILLSVSLMLIGANLRKLKAKHAEVNEHKLMHAEKRNDISLREFISRNKIFFVVNIGVLGVFFCNAITNNFMMQIVADVGGTSEDMGRIFSLMAFLEIPTMFYFDAIRKKFTCQFMLKVASVGFTLKIGMCFLAQSVSMIFAAQFMQLFSFALFLPAMVHFVDEIMTKGEAVRGQALFTTMITVTTVFASFIGGIILDVSGAKTLTLVATVITLIGTLIIVYSVDKVKVIKTEECVHCSNS